MVSSSIQNKPNWPLTASKSFNIKSEVDSGNHRDWSIISVRKYIKLCNQSIYTLTSGSRRPVSVCWQKRHRWGYSRHETLCIQSVSPLSLSGPVQHPYNHKYHYGYYYLQPRRKWENICCWFLTGHWKTCTPLNRLEAVDCMAVSSPTTFHERYERINCGGLVFDREGDPIADANEGK